VSPARCPAGVEPADAAAWALDAEPHPDVDLAAHVPGCAACQAAVAQVTPARATADTLRSARPPAPAAVTSRAVGRIRFDATTLLLARSLGGALARVAAAVPDYLPRKKGDRRA
jgi:hypothetical protein